MVEVGHIFDTALTISLALGEEFVADPDRAPIRFPRDIVLDQLKLLGAAHGAVFACGVPVVDADAWMPHDGEPSFFAGEALPSVNLWAGAGALLHQVAEREGMGPAVRATLHRLRSAVHAAGILSLAQSCGSLSSRPRTRRLCELRVQRATRRGRA